jgi:hypothetical protein
MGRQQPGKKISRKIMIRYANEEHRIAQRNLKAVQNAIIANANMQQMLQHEMCVCSHGATKHWEQPDRICTTEGCTCVGWRSLWVQAFEVWKEQIPVEVDKLELPFTSEQMDAVMAGIDLPNWFDSSVKPHHAAQRIKERLEKPEVPAEDAGNAIDATDRFKGMAAPEGKEDGNSGSTVQDASAGSAEALPADGKAVQDQANTEA